MKKKRNCKSGVTVIVTLVFASVAIVIMTGLVSWFGGLMNATRNIHTGEQALQIAEAGIDYYKWRLAHYPTDYTDGTGTSGPYVHDFEDKDGDKIGTFSLTITPPPAWSTVVTVESEGRTIINPNLYRKIRAKFAIPSLATFAVVNNETVRFGEGTVVYGPIHSNGGIRFDGVANNIITSAKSSYDDPDHSGAVEFGVHTHVTAGTGGSVNDNFRPLEAPPSTVQNRSDVFTAGRTFPRPTYDFQAISSNLSSIKTEAANNGMSFSQTNAYGYHVVLKTNDTFDLYKVLTQYRLQGACARNINDQDGWGPWGIATQQLIGNYPIPNNGVMFFQDHVWVDGKIDGIRLTIGAGNFPDTDITKRRNIIVNKDLLYTKKDGTDSIALMAQNNVLVGINAENNLEIDAGLIAQNGFVGRYYYNRSQCEGYDSLDNLTLYGMIASNKRYGFAYSDGTGYAERDIIYDANMLYSPPPMFPMAGENYKIFLWEEIK